MRVSHAGSIPLALTLTVLLSACGGGAMQGPGPFGGPPPPPRPALFVSPFGEAFTADPGARWPVSDWFQGADADRDGALTFEEFSADGRRWFGRLDTDGDGRLNQTELAAYEQSLRSFGEGAGPGGQPGAGPQRQQAGSRMRRAGARGGGYGPVAEAGFFNLPQPVKSADVNFDQRVTVEEWATATTRWFTALDGDRDGRLTLETLPKTPLQAQADRARR